ncbi:alpha/beta hydrolase family protein [Thalassovita aquimarina]|uniref:alpha/beta hydrolase family protein n=1 Tax=Thalassovita aquimarina TaxID=2785917 RepID=UPI003564BD67
MTDIRTEPVTFPARDGTTLGGTVISGPDPQRAVLVSAATGFPQYYYHKAAQYLAGRGALVLTYDYRGIGASRAGDLAGSDIDIADWGRFDMAAAVDLLADRAGGLPMGHLTHSVGGHLVGLLDNHEKVDKHAFFAVGSGFWPYHKPHYIPLELYFWWGIGAWSLMRHGYLKTGGGWTGEPLPPKAFRTWRRWSHRRRYLGTDLDSRLQPHAYGEIAAPIRSWVFADDPIATDRAAQTIQDLYPAAPKTLTRRSPADYGLKRIGHEGAFRSGREAIWQEVWDWFAAAGA